MTSMQTEVFEAFRCIEIPEDKAIKAASALGKRDNDFTAALGKRDEQIVRLTVDIQRLTGDMQLAKWMQGFVLALLVALLFRASSH